MSEQPDAVSYFVKERLNIQFTQGHHYIGGFIESPNMKQNWFQPTIQQLATKVEILSKVAVSLQAESHYLCRVMSFAIHSKFLFTLLGVESIDDNFKSLLSNKLELKPGTQQQLLMFSTHFHALQLMY